MTTLEISLIFIIAFLSGFYLGRLSILTSKIEELYKEIFKK